MAVSGAGAGAGAVIGVGAGAGAVVRAVGAVVMDGVYNLNILQRIKKMEQEEESPATQIAVITIDSNLRKRVRVRVAQLGTTIKSFCEEAILNHLDSQDDHK